MITFLFFVVWAANLANKNGERIETNEPQYTARMVCPMDKAKSRVKPSWQPPHGSSLWHLTLEGWLLQLAAT